MKYREALMHSLRLDCDEWAEIAKSQTKDGANSVRAALRTEGLVPASTSKSDDDGMDALVRKVGHKLTHSWGFTWSANRFVIAKVISKSALDYEDHQTPEIIRHLINRNIDISHLIPSIIEAGDKISDKLFLSIEDIENMVITDKTKKIIESTIVNGTSALDPKHIDLVMRVLNDMNDKDARRRSMYLYYSIPHGREVASSLKHLFKHHAELFPDMKAVE